MKKKIRIQLITCLCCLAVLISGCTNENESHREAQTIEGLDHTPLPTHTAVPTLAKPTATNEPEILVHTPTPAVPTATSTPALPGIACEDMTFLSNFPGGTRPGGKLVMHGKYEDYSEVNDLRSGEITTVTRFRKILAWDPKPSPDKKWIGYQSYPELIVQSIDGTEVYRYAWDFEVNTFLHSWVNNDWLMAVTMDDPYDALTLVNAFTGERRKLDNAYPNMVIEDHGWDFAWTSIMSYSPDLTRVLYVGKNPDGGRSLVLWDLEREEMIVEYPDIGFILLPPMWTDDSKQYVFEKNSVFATDPKTSELIVSDRDGNIIAQTRIMEKYEEGLISFSYSWSPDHRYVAYAMSTRRAGDSRFVRSLFVYDLAADQVYNYCVIPKSWSRLVWSPDSKFLAVAIEIPGRPVNTMIIDLAEKTAVKVGEDLEPIVWTE